MVIEDFIDSLIVSEVIYKHVHRKFEIAKTSLVNAQKKVVYFIESLRSLSEDSENVSLQIITRRQLHTLLDTFEKCVKQFDTYFSIINTGLGSYQNLMHFSAGNVDGMFMEITGKVLELFISLEKGIEDQMKYIQDIMEEVGSLLPLDESDHLHYIIYRMV